RLARDLAAITGIAGVEIGKAPDADGMRIASGEQRCARRRAHRAGMKTAVAEAFGSEAIDRRRFDQRAVAAKIGKADVVEKDDHNVGGTGRPLRSPWPPRLRIRNRLADGTAKRRFAIAHASLPEP